MSAISLPILTASGRLVAAIGIGAINERMSATRIESKLLPLLRDEVVVLSDKFNELEGENLL
jgi:DNA-binding IclR family transcriptional regulator